MKKDNITTLDDYEEVLKDYEDLNKKFKKRGKQIEDLKKEIISLKGNNTELLKAVAELEREYKEKLKSMIVGIFVYLL